MIYSIYSNAFTCVFGYIFKELTKTKTYTIVYVVKDLDQHVGYVCCFMT